MFARWPATTDVLKDLGYVFRMVDEPCVHCDLLIAWVLTPIGRVVPLEKDDEDRWVEHTTRCPHANNPKRTRRPKDTSQLRGLGEEYVHRT